MTWVRKSVNLISVIIHVINAKPVTGYPNMSGLNHYRTSLRKKSNCRSERVTTPRVGQAQRIHNKMRFTLAKNNVCCW